MDYPKRSPKLTRNISTSGAGALELSYHYYPGRRRSIATAVVAAHDDGYSDADYKTVLGIVRAPLSYLIGKALGFLQRSVQIGPIRR